MGYSDDLDSLKPTGKLMGIRRNFTKDDQIKMRIKLLKLKYIFNYLMQNAMDQPEGKWFDRKRGEEGIYAEPKNEMLK